MALPAPASRLKRITAKWRYSSGAGHFAYDYAMPTGTPLFATGAGRIAACQDGVVDHTPGRAGNRIGQAGSGSPSNWVLLETLDPKGNKVTIYYQHLADTKVKAGQKVTEGQLIGYSGSTGNATGPHLHIAAMKGWGYARSTRYAYMANNGKGKALIYPPTKAWQAGRAKRIWVSTVTATVAAVAIAFGVSATDLGKANPNIGTITPGEVVVLPPKAAAKPAPIKTIRPKAPVTLTFTAPRTATKGTTVTLTGKAAPISFNNGSTVVVQRWVGGKWTALGRATVRPSGRWTYLTVPSTAGTFTYRVWKPSTKRTNGAVTGVLKVTVR